MIDGSKKQTLARWILLISLPGWSWLGMMAVHELGHVAGAGLTGGVVEKVVLHPLTFSRTDLAVNPQPLLVAWAGPVAGCVVPLLLLGMWHVVRLETVRASARVDSFHAMLRWFAGFCLIANGAYIGIGWIERVGDAGDLLRHGAAAWHCTLFGLATFSLGLYLWHGTGRHLGFARNNAPVHLATAYTSLAIFVVLAVAGSIFGGQ